MEAGVDVWTGGQRLDGRYQLADVLEREVTRGEHFGEAVDLSVRTHGLHVRHTLACLGAKRLLGIKSSPHIREGSVFPDQSFCQFEAVSFAAQSQDLRRRRCSDGV